MLPSLGEEQLRVDQGPPGVCSDDDPLDGAGWHAGDLSENSDADGVHRSGSACDQETSSIENKFSKSTVAVTLGFH